MSENINRATCRRSILGSALLLAITCAAGPACATRGPAIGTGEPSTSISGTISGIVRAAESKEPLSGRRVTATEITTGATYDATTNVTGGYTMKLPTGRYRVSVELREGESVAEGPSELTLDKSDMDAGRDFLIVVRPRGR